MSYELINCLVQISSTSPVTALLSVRAPTTSFAVVQLDGSVDWMVAQRQALLAWTGHSMSIRPMFNRKLVCYIPHGIVIDVDSRT